LELKPFAHGVEAEDKYEWVAFRVGEGDFLG